MKFSLQHPLPADISTAWETLMSEEFSSASYAHLGTQREKISEEEKEGKILSTLQITLKDELPPLAAKVIGSKRLSWIQEQIIDNSIHTMRWRIRILGTNKITATGVFSLQTNGEHCLRIVEGDVQVGIPIVGRKVEKHVCKQLESSYQKTAEFSHKWLLDQHS